MAGALCLALGAAAACDHGPTPAGSDLPAAPAAAPGPLAIKRLTRAQYAQTLRDLVGDIAIPSPLEPDLASDGFLVVGAGKTSISALGVDRYEAAAYAVAAQAMAPGATRDKLVPCAPLSASSPDGSSGSASSPDGSSGSASSPDADCASQFVTRFGRRAFRRPLTGSETDRYVAIAAQAAQTLGDFYQGLQFAMAAMLQSPNFLFRIEVGEPNPNGGGLRYTSWDMATRLSYFLWNSTPDDELLDAAERGELTDDDGLARQVQRMLASPKAEDGARNFFAERFSLFALDDLVKDTTIFPETSADLGPAAREETLRALVDLVFDRDGDIREMMTGRRTFLDRRLSALYRVPAPALDGFGPTLLPEDGERQGLLGNASILAEFAHATSSSSTLRGKFIRTMLLCATIPPPPVNVNTAIPPASDDQPTLRDRMKAHMLNPNCAGCHSLMDPIGLGLEHFDGLGEFRTTEHHVSHSGAAVDVPIDASGVLDGVPFADARGLGQAIAAHPAFLPCLTRHLYRYAVGRVEVDGEEALLGWFTQALAADGYRVRPLLARIAMSQGFRTAQVPQ